LCGVVRRLVLLEFANRHHGNDGLIYCFKYGVISAGQKYFGARFARLLSFMGGKSVHHFLINKYLPSDE
jgi:hypothetical protein